MIAKKVDLNQNQIIKDLRKIGATVTVISSLGRGVPDLLVSYESKWYVFEIKNPELPKSKQRLTKDEQNWINKQRASVHIIRDMYDILKAFRGEL